MTPCAHLIDSRHEFLSSHEGTNMATPTNRMYPVYTLDASILSIKLLNNSSFLQPGMHQWYSRMIITLFSSFSTPGRYHLHWSPSRLVYTSCPKAFRDPVFFFGSGCVFSSSFCCSLSTFFFFSLSLSLFLIFFFLSRLRYDMPPPRWLWGVRVGSNFNIVYRKSNWTRLPCPLDKIKGKASPRWWCYDVNEKREIVA